MDFFLLLLLRLDVFDNVVVVVVMALVLSLGTSEVCVVASFAAVVSNHGAG